MKPTAAQRERDRTHMARCLELAEAYRGQTSPNPIVGCVIVDRRGRVIAEGAHTGPGAPHAEAVALAKLGGRAHGATLYVNLEPCNHHGRTPPCAPAVRDSGVARVVIGCEDPARGHGGGARLLRRGCDVEVGVLRGPCERANAAFLTWARHARPRFTLKAAVTLDGKIATVADHSKWITGTAARADVMRLRSVHDAVLVGVGTVLADDPRLTARRPGARDPIRIVLDSRLRTPPSARLVPNRQRRAPRTIIVGGPEASAARGRALVARGAEVWRMPARRDLRVDLPALAHRLAVENITSVLVEGGAEVHASLLAHGLADELVLYVAPKIVGGPAKSWVGGVGIRQLADAFAFEFEDVAVALGGDLRLTAVARPR